VLPDDWTILSSITTLLPITEGVVVNFANSLLCGVIYAQLPRQVKVDMKSLFSTSIQ